MIALQTGKKISVAMTTYNGSGYLEDQLLSILSQTHPPFEIVICDDRSTDNTAGIIQQLQEKYPLIRYAVNERRLGVVENFRKAVSLTGDADFIALSDQDDIWLPDKLEKSAAKLSALDDRQRPALVYSDLTLADEHGKTRNPSFWNELGQDIYTHCFETLVFGNFVTGCTVLMNKSMRDHFMKMPADVVMHDAWLSLVAFSVGRADRIAEPLVLYRSHAANTIFSRNAYRKKSRMERIVDHLRNSVSKNNFLEREIRLVEIFLGQYERSLNHQQLHAVNTLLQLKHRSYLRKLMVFRRVLRSFRVR
ncbi:MAG: glycosyltransferase family 2 protein [Chitinophagaceae bacterium]|nr:glycosyltransferase family 2 protein [Chitinophagaceae bacterium]